MTTQTDQPVRRILVATDLSTRSDRALRRATLIAKRLGSALSLVHVIEADQPKRMIEAERSEALIVLEEMVQTSCAADGVAATYGVVVDDAFPGILAAADDFAADLIVVGPHRSRFRDVFAGTTVERVLRLGHRPLLVAIQPPSTSYERTLLALDIDTASAAAARGALGMGIFERTAVTVMHAFDVPAEGMMQRSMLEPEMIEDHVGDQRDEAARRLHDFSEDIGLPASDRRVVPIKGNPARSILDSAKDENSDLIVVGTSRKGGMKRLLIGSVMEQVVRDARRDILIIPAEDDRGRAPDGPAGEAPAGAT